MGARAAALHAAAACCGAELRGVLGVGAVVLSNSAKMLVVGIVLVFMHDEGHMMPRGCEENIFMLFLCRGGHFMCPEWSFWG